MEMFFQKLLASRMNKIIAITGLVLFALPCSQASASEASLIIPEFSSTQTSLLYGGLVICILGMIFGLYQFLGIRRLKAHQSMLDVAGIIYETCKSYMFQQGRFLIILFCLVGACIAFYFGYLQDTSAAGVFLILLWTVIGIMGSYMVAFYGMRVNTYANSRMAYASLQKKPLRLLNIPLNAGMSIGVLLISVELFLMLIILLFVPRDYMGACFIGFAIGESLGASALRIAGGIFTKIADIGSDLMKIVFKIREDDPRNPGVIADCTGDNAGDSVGPTADGFETYGVTIVALITFICLAVGLMENPLGLAAEGVAAASTLIQSSILVWVFGIGVLMVVSSIVAFYINKALSASKYSNSDDFNFEAPLTSLVWIAAVCAIVVTFAISYVMLGPGSEIGQHSTSLWYVLASIIACGTLGAALVPEFTKIFTSSNSAHIKETVSASEEGGASLNILAGFVAGNFSAFWLGMLFFGLMFVVYLLSTQELALFMSYPTIFSFGLLAFGFLSLAPITIAVDSYGPVTDNAQSIYELSLIEEIPGIHEELEKEFGYKADMEKAHYYLESNDSAGNTFKATAKPVLIGTAVVGATILIFSLVLVIKNTLNVEPTDVLHLLNPYTLFGFLCGGAVIYWFTGAATQAVATGAYRAVEYIKEHIDLDPDASKSAALENSKEVVKICTRYAQKGMFNIFVAIFSFALAFACFSSPISGMEALSFFISYLVSIAFFGLYQAIFMANAGGCWDNSKKYVEVDMKQKGTPLHDATVVGDTVGDPFKDTSSVALNPIIKFTTLFGMLAMEIAITPDFQSIAPYLGIVFFGIALVFVYRSFYKMRISTLAADKK